MKLVSGRTRRVVGACAVLMCGLTACSSPRATAPDRTTSAPTTASSSNVASTYPAPSTQASTPSPPGPIAASSASPGDRRHPGAAVLAGDVRHVPYGRVIPPLTQPDTPAPYKTCQVAQTKSKPHPCTLLNPPDRRLTVAVVGDSVAGEWLPALLRIAARRHWKIISELHSRCPFSATMTVNSGETTPYRACYEWGVAVQKQLLTSIEPDVVITSDRPVLGIPGHPAPSRSTLSAIGRGMARYWRALIAHGITVVPIRESPEMGFDVPACLRQSHGALGPCSAPARTAVTPHPPTVVAASLVKRVRIINMNPLICAAPTCRPVVGNVLIYRDLHHVTREYMQTLRPYLARKLLDRVPALR